MRALAVLISIIFLSSSISNVLAGELNRRKSVVQYVRAATGCIESTIKKDARFSSYARGKISLDDIAFSAIRGECATLIRIMISAHDDAYYTGKGLEFFRGAYLEDLGRALTTRLKPAVEAIRAKDAKESLEAKTRKETNESMFYMARSSTLECVYKEVKEMLSSQETADVIVRAGITLCSEKLNYMVAALCLAHTCANDGVARVAAENYVREQVTAQVVKARVHGQKPQQSPSTVDGKTF